MSNQASTEGGLHGRGFDRRRAVTAIAISLTINALCPFLLFRHLAPEFPSGSVEPLLYVTVFPVAGLILSVARKRSIDAIAIVVLLGLATRIGVTIVAGDVKTALGARSLEGAVIGLAFLASVIYDRPIILLFAGQIATAGGREREAGLLHDHPGLGPLPHRDERGARGLGSHPAAGPISSRVSSARCPGQSGARRLERPMSDLAYARP